MIPIPGTMMQNSELPFLTKTTSLQTQNHACKEADNHCQMVYPDQNKYHLYMINHLPC